MTAVASRAVSYGRRASAALSSPGATAGAIAGLAGVIYLRAGPSSVDDAFIPLARALLAGRFVVPDGSAMELVQRGDGFSYVPFPPVPALPFMAAQLLHLTISNPTLTAIAGAIAVALVFPLLRALQVRPAPALWVTAGFAATLLWMAGTGGTWIYAQVLAAALLLASLNLALRERAPMLAGLLLGLAAGSRLPAGLALPLLIYLYRRSWLQWAQLGEGVLLVALPIAWYNVVRFGSPFEFGYGAIASFNGVPTVRGEEWYANGIESLAYIPRSLAAMLFNGFHVVTEAPWLRPDWSGLSIALAAPIFLLAPRGWRPRLGMLALATAALVMLPNWMHGNWGFYQYGYRFLLDAMPVLLIALALAYRERADRWLMGAVILTLLVNAYGLWADAANLMVGPTT